MFGGRGTSGRPNRLGFARCVAAALHVAPLTLTALRGARRPQAGDLCGVAGLVATRAGRPAHERLRSRPTPVASDTVIMVQDIPAGVIAGAVGSRRKSVGLAIGDQDGGQLQPRGGSRAAERLRTCGGVCTRGILPVSIHDSTT